jgi:malic enzyme
LHPFPGTAEALAAQVTQENFDKGLIYPPFKNIRKISAEIAAKVAAKAYELGESLFFCYDSLFCNLLIWIY